MFKTRPLFPLCLPSVATQQIDRCTQQGECTATQIDKPGQNFAQPNSAPAMIERVHPIEHTNAIWAYIASSSIARQTLPQHALPSGTESSYQPITVQHIQQWTGMSQIEREHITFNGFAKQHQLDPSRFRRYVTIYGQLRLQGQIFCNREKGIRYKKTKLAHIQTWQAMSQEERKNISFNGFAEKHQLNPIALQNYVAANGQLRAQGQALLSKQQGIQYKKIECAHIQAWQAMSQEERKNITLNGFAKKHQLNPRSITHYITLGGKVKSTGQALLNKQQGIRDKRIEWAHIQAWQAMPQEERKRITLNGFAEKHQLNPQNFANYVSVDGKVKAQGQALLNKQQGIRCKKIEYAHIQAWQAILQEKRKHITFNGFAEKHQLNPRSFANYVSVDGEVKSRGKALLNKQPDIQYKKIEYAHIQAWQAMPQEERKRITRNGFTEKYQINPRSFANYVTVDGEVKSRGKVFLDKAIDIQAQQTRLIQAATANRALSTPALPEEGEFDLKLFPAPGYPIEVQAITHQINNDAPILQHHITGQSLTGDVTQSHVSRTSWVALRPFFCKLSRSVQRQIKQNILQQVKEWILTEGNHQQRFDDMLSVVNTIDDAVSRGTSVFAKKRIPAFTVIGPYSGTLLPDQSALEQLAKQYGHNNIQTYLYQAGPATGPERDRTISAFRSGNVLSLINDAELSDPILDGNGQVLKNNIAAIRVDNKIFLVSVTDILPEQELFLDYGEEYQAHFEKQMALHQQIISIKKEMD